MGTQTFDLNVTYTTPEGDRCKVLITDPDSHGLIPVSWQEEGSEVNYSLRFANNLTPLPKRYVVEERRPEAGEMFLYGEQGLSPHGVRYVVVELL